MGLFSKSKKVSAGALRLDGFLRDLYGETFHFDDENFWLGINGSTVLTILYLEHSDELSTVHINAQVVRAVEATPALCRDLLTNPDYRFNVGRWEIEADANAEGRSAVLLGVDLVDHQGSLEQHELSLILGSLAETADSIDDQLAARYGGLTAVDYFTQSEGA